VADRKVKPGRFTERSSVGRCASLRPLSPSLRGSRCRKASRSATHPANTSTSCWPTVAGAASRFFWSARTQRDLYQDSLARDWVQRHANFRYTPVLSEPDADWRGERGLVHEALLRAYPDLSVHEAYLAGPPAMLHAGKSAFTAAATTPITSTTTRSATPSRPGRECGSSSHGDRVI
jgi:hypothetical protein